MHSLELVGDFLGAESYLDLRADVEDISQRVGSGKQKERLQVKKEYPPPLPRLVRMERSSTSQMPWVMKRSYTEDGRLIITEEKPEPYEYFRVHRSDGRLRLDLVLIHEPFWNEEQEEVPNETTEEYVSAESLGVHADHGGSGEAGSSVGSVATSVEAACVMGSDGDGSGSGRVGGGGNKCSSSLVFGVAVPALHPVHT